MARSQTGKNDIKELLVSWLTFNNAYRILGLIFIVMGLSFYVGWSILYDTWTDSGLYSVVVILVVFGVLSVLLAGEKKKQEQKNQ